MKITDIKAEKVRIELTVPFRVAFAEINYSENLLLKVSTDEGIDGYGEAAPMPFVTGETIDSVISVINTVSYTHLLPEVASPSAFFNNINDFFIIRIGKHSALFLQSYLHTDSI